MPVVKVEVKWQKEVYRDVEIDTEQPPAVFKTQLFSLTGVPPERQKVMGFKGGLLKDDADWAAAGAKAGLKITMMGTADKVPEAPAQQRAFVEDLPEAEQDTTGLAKYGAGLQNLGNTCYMNSTVQCLYAVPELRQSLAAAPPPGGGGDPASGLTAAARGLFASLERSAQPVPPLEFILSLRRAHPQFDQRARDGHHMQQDAEECWGALLLTLRERVRDDDGTPAVNRLFGVRTHAVLRCEETEETMELDEVELMLKCNITSEVNHLSEGLRLGLRGDREKTSARLGRLAAFRGEARVTALPPYATVQMVRFFYKADVQQKAKILRKVTFPLTLDLYELCDDALQRRLEAPRAAYKAAEDARVGLAKKQKMDPAVEPAAAAAATAAEAAGPAPDAAGAATANGDAEMRDAEAAAAAAGSQAGALTGRYELIGVLTHKGRSADSGHYVAWVKQPDAQWIQFDDDQMIPRKEEEVLALSGGGDWHMAYLLLYRAQRVPKAAAGEAKA